MLKYTGSLLIILLGGLFQGSMFLFWGDVKPNLVLVLLLFFGGIYTSWYERIAAISIAAFSVKFFSGIGLPDVGFLAAAFLGMGLLDMLPWRRWMNYSLAVCCATVIMHLSFGTFELFMPELVRNVVMAGVVHIAFDPFYAKEKRKRSRSSF